MGYVISVCEPYMAPSNALVTQLKPNSRLVSSPNRNGKMNE